MKFSAHEGMFIIIQRVGVGLLMEAPFAKGGGDQHMDLKTTKIPAYINSFLTP